MGIVDFVEKGEIESTEQFIVLVGVAQRNLAGQSQDDFLIEVCKGYLKLKGVPDEIL